MYHSFIVLSHGEKTEDIDNLKTYFLWGETQSVMYTKTLFRFESLYFLKYQKQSKEFTLFCFAIVLHEHELINKPLIAYNLVFADTPFPNCK